MEFHSDDLKVSFASIRDSQERVEINVFQCKRLCNRIVGINTDLGVYKSSLKDEDIANLHEYLVLLLKRARTLVTECGEPEWLEKALTRVNNREAFIEVHKELTKFLHRYTGSTSAVEGSTDFRTVTLPPTTNVLNEDADRDLHEILVRLEKHQRTLEETSNPGKAKNVAQIIKVISDKRKDAVSGQDICPSYLQIPSSEITRIEVIGNGSYGVVYRAEWLGCPMVLKDFPWTGGYSKTWLQHATLLLKLGHPNVQQVVGFSPSVSDTEESKVLTEILHRDIRRVIDRIMEEKNGEGTPFRWCTALDIMTQVARGLSCMHQNGFMHGDRVLTFNIIVKEYADYMVVMLGDFGVPQDLPVEHKHVFEPRLGDPKGSETARWMAPEVCDPALRGAGRYSSSSDIYSFGMFCYELLTGKRPFEHYTDVGAVHSHIMAGERPKLPQNLDERVAHIIRQCWHMDHSLRPTAQAILNALENIQLCV